MRKASLFCKTHALGYVPFIVLLKCGNYIKFLSHSLQNKNHQAHAHEQKPHVSSFKVSIKSKRAQVMESERKHLDA